MSATGALILALSAIILLGAIAAWLLNLPLWFVGAVLLGGGLIARKLLHRRSKQGASQDTV